ncbi:MAG: hypothetical protein ACF787_05065, partial [Rhodopirellula sp. JB053]
YWGNQIWETENQVGDTAVNNADLFGVFGGFTSAGDPAGIESNFDVNRDNVVNNADLFAIFGGFTSAGDSLILFTPPAAVFPAMMPASFAGVVDSVFAGLDEELLDEESGLF